MHIEPFGYFRAEPFGWTDCEECDEGAMPLFDGAVIMDLQKQLTTERASLLAESQRKQQLEGQVLQLMIALKFYADKQRYMGSNQRVEAPDIYGESPSNTVYLWDVMKDGGDIARAAIQKVRGGE